jgi:tRNA 2-selenouridine synthase
MMAMTQAVDRAALERFDDIVDVRSPAEFEDDHIPGAINLPVLDNEERARIGAIYVQQSRFLARRMGAALVARNIARHLESGLANKPGSWAPLVYCWRGGQRSGAMATVLQQVGWRPTVLEGGYKTYRRRVSGSLYETPPGLNLVLLDGYTGCGKTEILRRAAFLGVQTLDLEDLARHRGSLFGDLPGQSQPSQKMFESRLWRIWEGLDPAQPVLVEAESSKVGEINLPPSLWRAMLTAPRIEISAPPRVRAAYLTRTYSDIITDPVGLEAILAKLPIHIGRSRLEEWRGLCRAGDFQALAASLIEHHYDPAYERSRRPDQRPPLATLQVSDLSLADLDTVARSIAARLTPPEPTHD